MLQRLNDRQVDPAKLARLGEALAGEVDLAAMPRLAPLLLSNAGTATVELRFGIDASGQPGVRGKVSATVQMRCQRCLEAMPIAIDAAVSLGIVMSPQQARDLSEDYEPLLVGEDPVPVATLVEEELLLAMPIVAMHPPEQCSTKVEPSPESGVAGPADTGSDAAEAKRRNPFAVLAGLRRDR